MPATILHTLFYSILTAARYAISILHIKKLRHGKDMGLVQGQGGTTRCLTPDGLVPKISQNLYGT
jgi:hypothetical protein